LPRQIAQPFTDWETFCRTLVEIRCGLDATNETVAWHPKLAGPPDEIGSSEVSFTGVEVLRAAALARLLLPANVQIVAPLAVLGPKLAQVALEFGATHLGYMAADGQVLDHPLAASQAMLDELRGACSTTAIKEEGISVITL